MDNYQTNSSLNKTQKTGFVLLLIFGILVIGLGGLQLRNTIYNPFAIHLAEGEVDLESLFANEEIRLQSVDTDHDGLNDWEELNFYETSPYLPDTDSDGITDLEEIDNGDNPLCPQGEECGSEFIGSDEGKTEFDLPITEGDIVTTVDILESAGFEEVGDEINVNLLEAIENPTKLRELLLETGDISEADLAQIDDETLMRIVGEMMETEMNNQPVNQ